MDKLDKSYFLKKIGILIIPIIISIMLVCIFKDSINKIEQETIKNSIGIILGIWGSLLGFLITIESIFVGFEGRNIRILRKTRVYKTIIFTFSITCIELIIFIIMFSIVMLCNKISMCQTYIFICSLLISCIEMFICVLFLTMGIYDSMEK